MAVSHQPSTSRQALAAEPFPNPLSTKQLSLELRREEKAFMSGRFGGHSMVDEFESWLGALRQYVSRLHRVHDGKRVVQAYDYVDSSVPMLARMFEKRLTPRLVKIRTLRNVQPVRIPRGSDSRNVFI